MPSTAELQALSYTGQSAFARGMTGDDFRAEYSRHGEAIRWWKAFDAPDDVTGPDGETAERNGKLYIEQDVSDYKALITATERDELVEDFGIIAKGATQIACLPDEIELSRGDRVVLPSRLMTGRIAFTPTSGANNLQRKYVSDIIEVIYNGATLATNRYNLSEAANGDGQITFTIPVPTDTVLIEFRYHPLYVYLDVSDRNPPRGADGERLPQRGILTLEQKID